MQKRTVLITGANTGIGRVTALELAKRGAYVVVTARDESKAKSVLDEISRVGGNCEFIPLELGSLSSVRKAASIFLASGLPLHVLINNAGLAGHRGITSDGFEIQFGVNHLGHFLLTSLLEEKLKESAPSRVVIVASKAHYRANALDLDIERKTKGLSGFPAYSNSKLANVLHAKHLAKRLAGTGVKTYALHPGVIATDVWRRVPRPFRSMVTRNMLTPEQGAETSIYCATEPSLDDESGRYYSATKDGPREREPSSLAMDTDLAAKLWERSEAWVAD